MGKSKFEVGFIFGAKKAGSFDKTFSGIKNTVKNLAKTVATVATTYVGVQALKSLGTTAIGSASNLEGCRNALNVVMKDEKKAAETMKWAVDFANKTPFETDSIVDATVRLESYGLNSQKVMRSVGDMAGVMNKDIMQAVEAVADAQTGELERMKEFGITKAMIAEKAGEMYRGVEIINKKDQIVDQEKFNDALFALMDDKFKGGMEIQANSFKGLMSTVKGIWKTGLGSLAGISSEGEIIPGSAFDKAKSGIKMIGDKLREFSDSGGFEKIALKMGDWISKAQTVAQAVKTTLTPPFEYVESKILLVVDTIKAKFDTMQPQINTIKQKFGELGGKLGAAFGSAKPIIDNLITNGLPILMNLVAGLTEKAAIFGNFVLDHWVGISAIIAGIGSAFVAAKIAGTIGTVVTAVKTGSTVFGAICTTFKSVGSAVKVAGAAFSFLTSPIGIVILLIGAAVAAGILICKNWDKIKEIAIDLGGKIGEIFTAIGEKVGVVFANIGETCKSTFTGIINAFSVFINVFVKGINFVTSGLNKLSFTVPDWVPGLGGKNFGFDIPQIPEIPMLAKGGIATKSTIAMVGEGREKEAIMPLSKLNKFIHSQPQQQATTQFNKTMGGLTLNFNPTYIIQGDVDKQDLETVNDNILARLEALINRILDNREKNKRRTSFGRV